jgi:uncharacterized membrane protein YdjX (TVP38/TMEM64 family)
LFERTKAAVWVNYLTSELNQQEPDNEPLQPRPVREILMGGAGFLLFMTLLIVAIHALGIENLQQFIRDAGPFAPLIYIGLKATTYIFAPLTSGPIQVVAGTLFDSIWLGTFYTLLGEVLGGSINFLIARRLGHPVVMRFVGKDGMKQVDTFYREQLGGWISLAVARIVLFSFWDFLSYAAGLTKSVRLSTYVLISIVFGFFPTFLFVWMGNTALADSRALVMIYVLAGVLILMPIVFRRRIAALLVWAAKSKTKR